MKLCLCRSGSAATEFALDISLEDAVSNCHSTPCLELAGFFAATKKPLSGDPASKRQLENELSLFSRCAGHDTFACNASFRVLASTLSLTGADLSGDSDFAACP
jgi:hypothetical protein